MYVLCTYLYIIIITTLSVDDATVLIVDFYFSASYVGKACRANDPHLNECVVRTGAPVIRRLTQGLRILYLIIKNE